LKRHIFPDWKHPERVADVNAGKFKIFGHPFVAGSGERRCRVCRYFAKLRKFADPLAANAPGRGRVSRFHLVPKGKWGGGGDDVDDNLIPVCGSGTTGHHGMWECKQNGWEVVGHVIRKTLTEAELDYVVGKKGTEWLDRHYPPALEPKEEDDGGGSESADVDLRDGDRGSGARGEAGSPAGVEGEGRGRTEGVPGG